MYNFWKICFRARNDSAHEVLTEMFTLLCWLSLATIPSVYANFWFAGKTRNTKHTCYSAVSPLSPGLARAANVPKATPTCLRHRLPLQEKHSKKLTDIPASLYMLCWTVGGKTKKITAQEVSGVTRAKESLTKKPVQLTWNNNNNNKFISLTLLIKLH